jgi:hypothetical protein
VIVEQITRDQQELDLQLLSLLAELLKCGKPGLADAIACVFPKSGDSHA